MQHISTILSQSPIQTPNMPKSEPSDTSNCEEWGTTSDPFAPEQTPPAEYINGADKLFDHLRIWFGAKVVDNERYGALAIIKWADYLHRHHATLDELRQAYRLCETMDYPPTNARDYLNLVRQHRYPSSDDALKIAVDCASRSLTGDAWQHGVIYATAQRVGYYALTHEPAYLLSSQWQNAYQDICDEADQGVVFDLPRQLMIQDQPSCADKLFVQGKLDELSQMLGLSA